MRAYVTNIMVVRIIFPVILQTVINEGIRPIGLVIHVEAHIYKSVVNYSLITCTVLTTPQKVMMISIMLPTTVTKSKTFQGCRT